MSPPTLSKGQRVTIIVLRVVLAGWFLLLAPFSFLIGMGSDACGTGCPGYESILGGAVLIFLGLLVVLYVQTIRWDRRMKTFGGKVMLPIGAAIAAPLLLLLIGTMAFQFEP